MKRHRNDVMSAETVSELDAIDATLAGAPVPAQHARLADLARELRASRRAPGQDFVATLDAKVAQGFAGAGAPTGGRRARVLMWTKPLRPMGVSPLSRPALVAALTALVAVAVAVPLAVSRGGHHPERVSGAAVGEAHSGGAKSAGPALAGPEEPALRGDEKAAGAGANAAAAPSSAAAAGSRRVERTATLDVGVAPGSIESTSQRVFTLASSVGGYVRQSNVSSGAPGQSGASFDVRIPSSSVSRAIAEFSQLGHVRSENDTTNDVTEQFNSLRDLLGTLQAERASLLRRLASASAPQQEAALKARVQYVQRRISQLQRELSGLRTRVDYTGMALTLTAETPPGAKQGNLTPGGAARAAGQILETALAVLVIGVAALFPLVAVALVAWLAIISSRRRLREQALDAS